MARADVLRSVRPVEGHVEPFHGEARGGLLKVALGEQFRHAQHLLPSMQMVKGFCGERLPDVAVAARLQVDVLPVPRLLLVQSFLQEHLDCTAKVLLQQAIMLGGDHRCVDWLREVVVQDLLPGSLILPLQDVLELLKGGSPVEMDFLGLLVEIGDGFVGSEFNAESTAVNVDLRFQFVKMWVLVLHLVQFLQKIFLVEGLFEKSQRWFLVD
jgi:hypothetical protein